MPSVRSGTRNLRIVVQRQGAETRNALNEPVRAWEELGKFWSKRFTQKPTEGWKSGQTAAQVERAFNVRYSHRAASITPQMRIVCNGRTFEIIGVNELGRQDGIDLVAIASAEEGLR